MIFPVDIIPHSVQILTKHVTPKYGALRIAPTRDCTHLFKIRFVEKGGGFYSYYKSDIEMKIVRKKLSFMHKKVLIHCVLKMGAILFGCNSASTLNITVDKNIIGAPKTRNIF